MTEKATYLTTEGRRKLEEELDYLLNVRRPQVAEQIRAAKEDGDISENAGYEEAKSQQAFLEGRILTLEGILNTAVTIEDDVPTDQVRMGSLVVVAERGGPNETFRIVGPAEADPKSGLISHESPLGKALLGQKVGKEVAVRTPDGTIYFTVRQIQ
ncbi:MAG: transcription elongation factor GreA [Chloroflexi bacterium]|nr:transcription elongation factor GreA [Chloroflexota bacterium]